MQTTIQDYNDCSPKELRDLVKEQMTSDLLYLLEQYNNKDIGLRLLSEKSGIGEKTLKRVLSQASDPQKQTIIQFYNYFFKICDAEKNEIHRYLKRKLIDFKPIDNDVAQSSNKNFEELLLENKVFRDLFLYSRTGPITKEFVQNEYGRYGLDLLERMAAYDIVIEADKNIFVQGPVSIAKNTETLKRIISDLIQDHLDTDKLLTVGINHAFYTVEGVTEATREKLLMLADDYRRRITDIMLNQSEKGNIRLFVTSVVDSLKDNEANNISLQ